jgi:homoserine kinase type II
MATYTQLNQNEIQKLADNYHLQITEFAPLDGGNGNSSHLIKTRKNTYVLTVCDDKTIDEVFKMGQLLLLLEINNVQCNRLITTHSGDILTTYTSVKEPKAVMLKGYIEGQVIEILDEVMLFEVGKQAAKLNQITAPDYLPSNHPYGRQLFPQVIGLNIDSEYEAWLAKEIEYLQRNLSDDLPRGLIHGDLFFDNLLFDYKSDKPDELVFKAIIDFEEACHYYSVFELGMAAVGTCIDDDINVNLDKVRALVAGYQQVRSLHSMEKQSLQLFIRYAAVATSYWRFNKYNVEEPEINKADHHWQMVVLAKSVRDMSANDFLTAVF